METYKSIRVKQIEIFSYEIHLIKNIVRVFNNKEKIDIIIQN